MGELPRQAVVFLTLYLFSSSPLPSRAETLNFSLIYGGLPGELTKSYASSVNLAFSDFSLERGRNKTSTLWLHRRSSTANVLSAAAGVGANPTNASSMFCLYLCLLVPVRYDNRPFVGITKDATANATIVVGFTIDVFDEVVNALPFGLLDDYIPDPLGSENYNNLIYQVFLGNYDAAVGDITYLSNRLDYVNFSMPYIESAASIPVLKSYKENDYTSHIFELFTWQLWLTILCFLISIGFVVWRLERHDMVRDNLARFALYYEALLSVHGATSVRNWRVRIRVSYRHSTGDRHIPSSSHGGDDCV